MRAVDVHHHATHQQLGEDVLHADVELVREVLHRHALGERDGARDGDRGRRRGRSRGRRAFARAAPRGASPRARRLERRREARRRRDGPACRGGRPCRADRGGWAVTGSGRGPPSMPGVVGRPGGGYAGTARRAPGRAVTPGRAAHRAHRAGRRRAGGVAGGGCTMRGCVTAGRLAGVIGRAGCGVLPGSSMRRRRVGGTKRPEAALCLGRGVGALGARRQLRAGFDRGSSTGDRRPPRPARLVPARRGLRLAPRRAAALRRTGSGTSATGSSTGSGAGATADAARRAVLERRRTAGLMVFTSRGGPSTGAAGLGGSTGFFSAGPFFAPGFAGAVRARRTCRRRAA